ncbi:hypothetical protein FWF64_04125, partial [Candidatus Saccharibacteria bacterium]|nr:hypothetical protein [Candidatus Saccharibacteria bacterium]
LPGGCSLNYTITFDAGGTPAPCTNVHIAANEESLTCTTTAHLAGIVDITVSDGTSTETLVNGYEYMDMSPPEITTPPQIEPIDNPNGSANSNGCNPVKVTLTTNVPIEIPDGYTKTGNLTYEKIYTENTTENVPMVGLNGIIGEDVEIVIDTIICQQEIPITPPTPPRITAPNTGLNAVQIGGMVITGLLMISVAGILVRKLKS